MKSKTDESHDSTVRRRSSVETLEHLSDFHIAEIEKLLLEDGIISKLNGVIGEGKEANVYWALDPRGKPLAIKMFRMFRTAHKDRFAQVLDTGKMQVAHELSLREFENLSLMYEAGVRVPKPIEQYEFIYTMEFLGTKTAPSPLLRNVNLTDLKIDPIDVLDDILDQVDIMFNKAEFVHGDFSEHNIIFHKDLPYVIDFLQSERYHPKYATDKRIKKKKALKILKRDIESILNHFIRTYRVGYDLNEVFNNMLGEYDEDWSVPDEYLMSEKFDSKIYKTIQKNFRT